MATLPAQWKTKWLERGDDRSWTELFEANTADDGATPTWEPLDLSGYGWLCQIRSSADSADVMATVDVAFTTDGTDGSLTLTLPHDESAGMVPGRVAIDLQSTDGDDNVLTWLVGSWHVKPDVSRPVGP